IGAVFVYGGGIVKKQRLSARGNHHGYNEHVPDTARRPRGKRERPQRRGLVHLVILPDKQGGPIRSNAAQNRVDKRGLQQRSLAPRREDLADDAVRRLVLLQFEPFSVRRDFALLPPVFGDLLLVANPCTVPLPYDV